ncbi:hypothetical protein AMECASPLE_036425 [Ameca splendens]|uniref:Uncharacterized protein n=1 Tax=Ameca splendens TaxID=208324 RepID=A0ABV0Y7I5_9TELE
MKVVLVMLKDGEEIVDVPVVLEEAVVLTDLKDIPSAVAMLMGLLYCLNIRYPNDRKYTFEVIQKVFMNIGGICSSLAHCLRNRLLPKTMYCKTPAELVLGPQPWLPHEMWYKLFWNFQNKLHLTYFQHLEKGG